MCEITFPPFIVCVYALYYSKVLINFSGNLALFFRAFFSCPQKCFVEEWASCTNSDAIARINLKKKWTFFSLICFDWILLIWNYFVHTFGVHCYMQHFMLAFYIIRYNFCTSRDQFSLCRYLILSYNLIGRRCQVLAYMYCTRFFSLLYRRSLERWTKWFSDSFNDFLKYASVMTSRSLWWQYNAYFTKRKTILHRIGNISKF